MKKRFLGPNGHCWWGAIALLILCADGFAGEHPVQHLSPLAAGITLPVTLTKTLDPKHIQPGQVIVAKLSQRVPLGGNRYLPEKTSLLGSVTSYNGKTLALRFTRLRLRDETEPVQIKLVAAAQWIDVENTKLPLGSTDRGTSNPEEWTTMQIGRDEVYREGGYGKVYNQYSEPVGNADPDGVYAAPRFPGAVPKAMGPFSTTAAGLYDLPKMNLRSRGGMNGPIVFQVESGQWQLHAADALLLEVVE